MRRCSTVSWAAFFGGGDVQVVSLIFIRSTVNMQICGDCLRQCTGGRSIPAGRVRVCSAPVALAVWLPFLL